MSSTTTFAAIMVGGSIGALAALWASPKPKQPNPQPSALPFRPISKSEPEPANEPEPTASSVASPQKEPSSATASSRSAAKAPVPKLQAPKAPARGTARARLAAAPSTVRDSNARKADIERFLALQPGPHERKVRDKAELEQARVDCAEKIPDECMRAADVYDEGKVAYKNKVEAEQFRKVALSLYVKQCEKKSPGACYSLARMFHEGDLVMPSEEQVLALMKRTHYLCEKGSAPICKKLSESK